MPQLVAVEERMARLVRRALRRILRTFNRFLWMFLGCFVLLLGGVVFVWMYFGGMMRTLVGSYISMIKWIHKKQTFFVDSLTGLTE